MTIQHKSKQRGLSFIGLLIVGAVLAAAGVIIAQVIPTTLEFESITKAATKAAVGSTVPEIRQLFDKAASIDNITSIAGKDLNITKDGDKVVVSFAYQREIHLGGPAYLTLKYAGQSR